MVNIADCVARYHDLMERYQNEMGEIVSGFSSRCEAKKLTFGGRAMFKFLRPNFISRPQYDYVAYVCSILRNTVTKFKNAALADARMMAQAGILQKEHELVAIDPGFSRLSITARWDSFMSGDTFKFVELNAECPAGIAYSDVAAGVFDALPFVSDFKKEYAVLDFNIRQTLLEGLLDTYESYKGNKRNKKPTIAIVDWKEVPTYTEFELLKEFFESRGFDCVIADPRDLVYEDGRLRYDKTTIDLVYKRILTNDCVERPDETRELVSAYRNHDVCMVNPFRAKLVHKKSIFAVLTHEMNHGMFTREELSLIEKHIPWTRLIRNEKTLFHGSWIDLVDYILNHKDSFVIKPNDEYGGKGVILGNEASQSDWEKVIHEALKGEPYVVQEIVPIPRESFPIFENSRIQYVDMVVDMDPYVFGSKVEGILTRLSASSLANVTAGGGTTPTLVVDRKLN